MKMPRCSVPGCLNDAWICSLDVRDGELIVEDGECFEHFEARRDREEEETDD